ncbi:MAG: glycosyltransferase family 9 protein [Candidatus Eremiobacteraeota bacterium]|nr:glycosyltransferase family 9 protein [Candidatus Eremiobacteraeota bacterium]MBC5827893.1 glycosyltransferase family 9 protein [Candidatus Eremiobacteraeota bacterium]
MKHHVLVARHDNNGDVILAGPALRAVAAGASRVTFLCGPRGRAAAALLPGVDELLVWEAGWIDAEPQAVSRADVDALLDRLVKLRIDQAFILTSYHQSALPLALLLRMAGIKTIAANSDDYAGSLLDVRMRPSNDIHEVVRSLSLVAALGYAPAASDSPRLALRLPQGPPMHPFRGRPFIAVHPGASVPARTWSPGRYGDLVSVLAARGDRVVVTGGPEDDEVACAVAGPQRANVLNFAGQTHFTQFARILGEASVVVSGNTAAAHVAAAVGTATVSLFPPTIPAVRFRPWQVPHVLLGDQTISCAGCRARVCPVEGHPCIESVSVQDALAAIDSLAVAEAAAS